MAENYKHLYEQTKKMLAMYQDNLIPGFRQKIDELEADNERLRKGWAEAISAHSKAKSECEYFRSRAAFFGEVAGVTDKVISVEGFKAFRGTMRITPKAAVPAYDLHGDWLYKPEAGCWFGKGSSFPEDICKIVEVK